MADLDADLDFALVEALTRKLLDEGEICGWPDEGEIVAVIAALLRAGVIARCSAGNGFDCTALATERWPAEGTAIYRSCAKHHAQVLARAAARPMVDGGAT